MEIPNNDFFCEARFPYPLPFYKISAFTSFVFEEMRRQIEFVKKRVL